MPLPDRDAAQHVDPRPAMPLQPGGEGRGVAVGQQIDDAMLVEIHQDRAIVAAAAEGEVVDAQGAQLRRDRTGSGDLSPTEEPQEGVPARPGLAQAQVSRESVSRLPAQCNAHGFQLLPQAGRPSLIGRRHLRQALAERLARTRRRATMIAPCVEAEADGKGSEGTSATTRVNQLWARRERRRQAGQRAERRVEVTATTSCSSSWHTESMRRPDQ